jgi:uracil-DNA glycosylase
MNSEKRVRISDHTRGVCELRCSLPNLPPHDRFSGSPGHTSPSGREGEHEKLDGKAGRLVRSRHRHIACERGQQCDGDPGQGKGSLSEKGPSDSVPAAVPTDEIYERYLKKAISEINELGDELARAGDELRVPVVGSGHPLADIMLLKFSPQPAEIQEGVAFFGRSGQAILKSLQRLHVDPLAIYGTNCLKFGTEDPVDAASWLTRELYIVQPTLVVAMGERSVAFLDALGFPLSDPLDGTPAGVIQRFTPTIHALVTPDVDEALDEAPAKTAFWNAFKALGPWWAEQPPY